PRGLNMLSKHKPESLPLVNAAPRFGVPCVGIGKFVAIGLNYSDHAKEAGLPIPSEPIVFMKATTCINGPHDDVIQPKNSTKLDWEIELGVVIGTQARYVEEAAALNHVAGYCVVNDVSERAFQMATSQWDKGKGFDSAGPIGPWLVTSDEIRDPQNLDMWLDVNGKPPIQDGAPPARPCRGHVLLDSRRPQGPRRMCRPVVRERRSLPAEDRGSRQAPGGDDGLCADLPDGASDRVRVRRPAGAH